MTVLISFFLLVSKEKKKKKNTLGTTSHLYSSMLGDPHTHTHTHTITPSHISFGWIKQHPHPQQGVCLRLREKPHQQVWVQKYNWLLSVWAVWRVILIKLIRMQKKKQKHEQ